MTISVQLSPATLEALEARAAATGKKIDTLVAEAVQKDMALGLLSLERTLKPIRQAIAKSGLSPQRAKTFFGRQLADVRAERRASPDRA